MLSYLTPRLLKPEFCHETCAPLALHHNVLKYFWNICIFDFYTLCFHDTYIYNRLYHIIRKISCENTLLRSNKPNSSKFLTQSDLVSQKKLGLTGIVYMINIATSEYIFTYCMLYKAINGSTKMQKGT